MPEQSETKLGIMISGSGSTMERIIRECREGKLSGLLSPVIVISSHSEAGGITKARAQDVAVKVVSRRDFPQGTAGTLQFGEKIVEVLTKHGAEAVSQNGWLAYTPQIVCEQYRGRIFNQHPGPTEFGGKGMHGLAVHAAVLKFQQLACRRFATEATIHRVTAVVDGGEVIRRRTVPVEENDTPESLQNRVLPVEHELQVAFWKDYHQSGGGTASAPRPEPLIRTGEEELLKAAIYWASMLYG